MPVVAVEVVAPNVKTVRRGATGVLAEVEASGRNVDETGKDRCCVRGPALRRGAGCATIGLPVSVRSTTTGAEEVPVVFAGDLEVA